MTIPCQLCAIQNWGLLEIRGADAGKFLQGQLTCDLRELEARTWLDGALCTPQGRVLASLRLFSVDTSIFLRMPRDLLEPIQHHLRHYAAFFPIDLEITQHQGLVLLGSVPDRLHTETMLASLETPQGREIWGEPEAVRSLVTALGDTCTLATEAAWLEQLIRSGSALIVAATSGEFLAHQLSLDLADAISFRKGCYTGQEIIARTQFRGKSKRRLVALRLAHPAGLAPGTTLEHSAGSAVHLLATTPQMDALLAQAVAPEDLPPSGTLLLGDIAINYLRISLPFDPGPG